MFLTLVEREPSDLKPEGGEKKTKQTSCSWICVAQSSEAERAQVLRGIGRETDTHVCEEPDGAF